MTRLSASILLYTIFVGFIAEDVAAIGIPPNEIPRLSVVGVPVRDVALLLALGCLALRHRQMLRIVCGRWLLLIVSFFLLGLLQGIVSNGFSHLLNSDIRNFLWLFGGIGFGLVMERARRVKTHLRSLLLLSTVLMVCASLFSPDYYEYRITGEAARVTHPSLYIFGGLMAVPLILLLNVTGLRLRAKLFPAVCLAFYFGFTAVLSSTRSALIITGVFVWILLASLRFRFKDGLLSIGKATHAGTAFFYSLTPIAAVFLIHLVDPRRAERFATLLDWKSLLTDLRVLELIDFFGSSDTTQLLIGRGVGGAINSSIYQGELAQTMHVGIANVWMKFGVLPFSIAVIFFLFVIPFRYAKSFRKLRDPAYRSTRIDTANVVVLPALLPWIVSLFLSGGYSEGSFLFAGFVFYVYCLVKRFGLDGFFSPAYSARTVPARSRSRVTVDVRMQGLPT